MKKENQEKIHPLDRECISYLHETIIDHFENLRDPRVDRTKRHKLLDIIFMAIAAVICGADNWKAVEVFALSRKEWLEEILQLSNGIPDHITFWRVFRRIDPIEFRKNFSKWVQAAFCGSKGEVIAIDGKTMRGSGNGNNKALHMVSAWAETHNITLAQVKVVEKSNEITAIPILLDTISVKEAVVTMDAMGCQKSIAEQIIDKGGDYVLALKGNHSTLHGEIENYFTQALDINFEDLDHDYFTVTEKDHGRIETGTVYVTGDLDWLPDKDKWANLRSIAMVISERIVKGKVSKEYHFYISSLNPKARRIAHAIRTHWGIENKVHWILARISHQFRKIGKNSSRN